MRIILVCLVFAALCSSCIKEEYTYYETILVNKSSHSIALHFYKEGRVNNTDTIKILPNDSFQLAKGSDMGLVNNGGFTSKYAGGPNDSLIVLFDNTYLVSHYANTPNEVSLKHLLFTSLRNVYNKFSYAYSYVDISKRKRNATYIYMFTDADYEFARE